MKPTVILSGYAICALILIWRAGLYPAVMTGDEIWFAESAWNLLHHGWPVRAIHRDAVGSAIADYLPPVVMLIQTAAFAVLGLNPVAVSVQSILAPLAVMALIYLLARRAGVSWGWAAVAGFAVLGCQSFLRAGLYIRYEALVCVFFLAYLTATQQACRQPGWGWHVARGAALALAGLCYYPQAPFIGLAALVIELGLRRRWSWRARVALASGFLSVAGLFAGFVAVHPAIFMRQILGNGAANYLAFDLLRAPWHSLRGALDTVPEGLALFGVLAWIGVSFRNQRAFVRLAALVIVISLTPALIYPFQARLLALPVLLAVGVAALWADGARGGQRFLARAGLVGLSAMAVASLGVMLATVIIQAAGRDYAPVSQALNQLLVEPGPAAIDQRAWLALRRNQPMRELHQIFNANAPRQVTIFRSRQLEEANSPGYFRYLILETATAAATIAATPALAGEPFTIIGRVQPPFIPLPWARYPPYDLTIYQRATEALIPAPRN